MPWIGDAGAIAVQFDLIKAVWPFGYFADTSAYIGSMKLILLGSEFATQHVNERRMGLLGGFAQPGNTTKHSDQIVFIGGPGPDSPVVSRVEPPLKHGGMT